jgi:putative ABC transport system permease protein
VKLLDWLFRRRLEEELDEEVRSHLRMAEHEHLARGESVEQARTSAVREFGNVDLVKEVTRDAWGWRWLEQLLQDARYGLRQLRRNPGFTAVAVITLALGIGANAAIFSVFDGLFLRPLPFPKSDRLIDLDETAPKWDLEHVGVSNPDLFAWREGNSTFDSMAFFRTPSFNFSNAGTAQRVEGAQVSHDLLTVLGLEPFIGRNFTSEDDRPSGPKVVMLKYGFWQQMFGGDRNVLGHIVKLDDEPYTVIGVLPRQASFPDRVQLWVPLAADPNVNSGYYVNGVGRLKPGVSIEQAQADLVRIHKTLVAQGHKVNEITSPILTPLRDRYLGDVKIVSGALLGAVGLVLLIACVNIGAFVMVRGSSRSREMAIRSALGASRGCILSQLVTENVVLAVIGGALGVLGGAVGLRAIVPALSDRLPHWISFSLDWRFVLFSFFVTGAAMLLFGLFPALQLSRVDIRSSVQASGGRITLPRGHRLTLSAFVICEIGLALTLSISAGLLLQAFRKVLTVDPGFQPRNVLTFRVAPPDDSYGRAELKIDYYDELLERLGALPGVIAAGATSAPPLGGQWGGVFEAEGARFDAQGGNPTILQVAVTPGYLEAIGMTILAGRTFERQDNETNSQMVAIVNETFAKHFWPNGNPIGKRIRRLGGSDWYEVIGLVKDEKHYGLDQGMKPSVFLPYSTALRTALKGDERAFQEMSVVLRSSADPKMLVSPAREIVRHMDSGVPMYEVHTMMEELNRSLWSRRAYTWLFGAFAMIAMFLSVTGIYGTVSYWVSQRIHEIGIRLALGAERGKILRMVMGEGLRSAIIGVGIGAAGALALTRFLSNMLFDVKPTDPLIFAIVAALLVTVALLASYIPARRATKVDPMVALRYE